MLRGLEGLLKGRGSAHKEVDCACGCVPNIMSLHGQARERARRREAAAASQRPTLGEYLAQKAVADVLITPAMPSAPNLVALECEPETPPT